MKTVFKKIDSSTVSISYDDYMTGERVTREFWIPISGGYIRESERQVCNGLSDRGYTLMANDQDDLLGAVRREYAAMRANDRRIFGQ